MKKLANVMITLIILVSINYGVSYFFKVGFFDYSFFIGLVMTLTIWFFTSKGGITTQNTNMLVQSKTMYKMESEKFTFSPSLVFYTSVGYTLISLVAMIIYYMDYFL